MGFKKTNLHQIKIHTGMTGGKLLVEDFKERIALYKKTRDFPAIKGVSYLSVHLRFGTLSIRQLFRLTQESFSEGAETWLNELIWREFYFQILSSLAKHYDFDLDTPWTSYSEEIQNILLWGSKDKINFSKSFTDSISNAHY